MYKTIRSITGGTLMTCVDCGHAVTMDKTCETPIQSATDMLKHMAAHNAARAFAPVQRSIVPAAEVVVPVEVALSQPETQLLSASTPLPSK